VTDLVKGGDLKQELMNTGLYSEKRAALLMKQILACVNYFHSKSIVHRDIKPGSK
jgi:serine/threonine protein kinase